MTDSPYREPGTVDAPSWAVELKDHPGGVLATIFDPKTGGRIGPLMLSPEARAFLAKVLHPEVTMALQNEYRRMTSAKLDAARAAAEASIESAEKQWGRW